MRLTRILAIAALAGSVGVVLNSGQTQAQIREQQPAEFPPASYNGKQYVDSKGCVFIRAGIDGDVSWVPRVTRDRKTVCGFKPTLSKAQAAVGPAPDPTPGQVIVLAPPTTIEPLAQPEIVAVRPAAAPRPVATAAVVRRPVSQQAAQPRAVTTVLRPMVSGARVLHVRGSEAVTSTTRIVPRHVAENRANTRNVAIPEGYKPIWNDGRLNPHRAEQTLAGRAQMALVWTNTLPRRLINAANGRDVTASVPLIYPYTSVTQQRAEIGEVSIVQRDGKTVKRIIRNTAATPTARTPVYSTRSAPAQALAGKRFVQVGTFQDAQNAQRAAKKIAGMGMPARIGKHRKGQTSYMTVQAGPFTGAQQIQTAMKRLQRAGYSDAFAR